MSLENRMWPLALVSMSWILFNLKAKTEAGHCQNTNHTHGERAPRLCRTGSQFHKELYDECLTSFKEMVHIAEKDPPKEILGNQ
jgi:hypothetical protein